MSNRYFQGRGNRGKFRRNERPGVAFDSVVSNSDSDNDEGAGRGRHPKHLRGKAIGLWYSQRNRESKEAGGERKPREKKNKGGMFKLELSMEGEREIQDILKKVEIKPNNLLRRNSLEGSSLEEKYQHVEESDFKKRFLASITGSLHEKVNDKLNMNRLGNNTLDVTYKEELLAKQRDRWYNEMVEFRKKLPAYNMREEVLDIVSKNQVVLISGETGCGKTTQVGQFLLDDQIMSQNGSRCYIVCTQPRRISTIAMAERVAEERAERCGRSVGYQIRLEKTLPRRTGSMLFCTTGVLLQYMQSDPALSFISHVILDEIHERDTLSDFVLCILKDVIPVRPDLKVILMSATLNAEKFSKYFNDCPTLNIPGFTFPVKEYYLEDVLEFTQFTYPPPVRKRKERTIKRKEKEMEDFMMPYLRNARNKFSTRVYSALLNPESEMINLDLILELLMYIVRTQPPGAILVFLPGWDKISTLNLLMQKSRCFPEASTLVIPLHSMLPTMSQKSVFNRPPPGVRKIVLATNIAETSITIDDIVYVIDCGKIKMKTIDSEKNLCALQEEWVSLANAKQRRGRAGRVQEGVCYHLYTRPREMLLLSYHLPEMLRTRLEEVILQAKILQVGKIEPFLQKVLDPPEPIMLEHSLKLLIGMNALDEEERLTPLGYHLASLPVDPQAGKMLIFAALFGCFKPITAIAASLSFKDPFYMPANKEDQVDRRKYELAGGLKSDHLLIAEVMQQWEEADRSRRGNQFISHYFLSRNTLVLLKDMMGQFAKELYDMKFLTSSHIDSHVSNRFSNNTALIKAVICAGLFPNVAIIKKIKKQVVTIFTPEDGRVKLHPKSVNEKQRVFESQFFVYYLKMKSTSIFLHDSTMVFYFPIILFSNTFKLEQEEDKTVIVINECLKFSCRKSIALLLQQIRNLLYWLLEYRVSHPGPINFDEESNSTLIVKALIRLFTIEHEMFISGLYGVDSPEHYQQGGEESDSSA